MPEEQTADLTEEIRWAISSDWLAQNSRSEAALVKDYLCADCAKKLYEKKTAPTLKMLQSSIESCCSKDPDFFNEKLPIAESIFRVFLCNGNKPLNAKDISAELGKLRPGENIYRSLPETLLNVLMNDIFYGLRQVR